MANDLLNHPDVVRTIRSELLGAGYPKHEIDDGVAIVQAEALEYLLAEKLEVETPDRMQAIVRPLARHRGIDGLRASSRNTRKIVADEKVAEERADGSVSVEARVDQRKAIALVRENLNDEEKHIVDGMLTGRSLKQTAEKIGASHDRVRKTKVSMLERSRSLLGNAGLLSVVAGGLALVGFILYKALAPGEEAHRQPAPAPSQTIAPPAPSPEIPVSTLTPEQAATVSALRDKAHEAATKKKWQACNDAYAEAAKIDWSGETPAQKVESNLCAKESFKSLIIKQ